MKGFTLIELLVVVLIVGVLSAVALPQYARVVEKARATEAMVNAKAITDAIQRHLQEFPDDVVGDTSQIADVKIQHKVEGYTNLYAGKYFSYQLGGNNLTVNRVENGNPFSAPLYTVRYVYNGDGAWTPSCTPASGKEDDYEQVCKLFTSL